jgi:hypothetical protein
VPATVGIGFKLNSLWHGAWSWNDVFRAVHDLVGHAATGFQFGPIGEILTPSSQYAPRNPTSLKQFPTEDPVGGNGRLSRAPNGCPLAKNN